MGAAEARGLDGGAVRGAVSGGGGAAAEGGAVFEHFSDVDALGAGKVAVGHVEEIAVPRQQVHQKGLAAPRRPKHLPPRGFAHMSTSLGGGERA